MASTAVITNKGLGIIASRIKGTGSEPVYLAWGSGSGTAAATDEALFTEESESRTTMVSEIISVSTANDAYKLTGAIVAGGSKTITNWGVFDAPTGGNLLLHESIDPGVPFETGQLGSFYFRVQITR